MLVVVLVVVVQAVLVVVQAVPWIGGWHKDHWLLVVGCFGPLAVDWWLAT